MDKRVYVSELENACLSGWLAGLGSVEYGGQSPPHHEDRSLSTGPLYIYPTTAGNSEK